MKIKAKGLEKRRLWGRRRRLLREIRREALRVFLPEAFSMMAL
jgi:hypothetical protein